MGTRASVLVVGEAIGQGALASAAGVAGYDDMPARKRARLRRSGAIVGLRSSTRLVY